MAASHTPRGGIIEGINVTPLVDIVLVLLLIFIVTAKLIVTPAVPLDLPRASQSEEVQTVFAVAVTAEGRLLLDDRPVSDAELERRAAAESARDGEVRAVIQADGNVPHRRVIEVLDALKRAGIERVAFGATKPAANGGAGGSGSRAATDP